MTESVSRQRATFQAQPYEQNEPGIILFVEDDDLIRMVASAMLDDLGFCVVAVASAEEALDIFQKELNIRLVISDFSLPNMTGAELVEIIKAQRENLPVIMASGHAGLLPGIAASLPRLTKPYLREDLYQAVEKALRDTAL